MEYFTKNKQGKCPYTGEDGTFVEDAPNGKTMVNTVGEYFRLHDNGTAFPLFDRTDQKSEPLIRVPQ